MITETLKPWSGQMFPNNTVYSLRGFDVLRNFQIQKCHPDLSFSSALKYNNAYWSFCFASKHLLNNETYINM